MTSKQWWPAAVLSLAIAPQAWAQWEGSLGAGVLYAPDYLGSDDYDAQLWPSINLDYGDTLSISPRSGIEWHAIRSGDWTVSPFIGYTFGRDNEGDIAAFEEVDGGATLGLRVALEQGQWQYSLAGSTPVSGDVEGAEFEASAAYRLVSVRFSPLAPAWLTQTKIGRSRCSRFPPTTACVAALRPITRMAAHGV